MTRPCCDLRPNHLAELVRTAATDSLGSDLDALEDCRLPNSNRRRGRPKQEIRDGHKWCGYHKTWQPVGEFDVKNASTGTLEPNCQVARMAMRDAVAATEDDAEYWGTGTCIDPELHAQAMKFIELRASEVVKRVRYVGVQIDRTFVMEELNYQALVPEVRTLIGPDGLCAWCGRPFTKKHKLSLDHIEPPRWDGTVDWERLHASNVQVIHFGENGSKNDKPYAIALRDNMARWMAERNWARHAGEPGWPSLDAMRLPPPEPIPEIAEVLEGQMSFDDLQL